jgi:hypothetical protein
MICFPFLSFVICTCLMIQFCFERTDGEGSGEERSDGDDDAGGGAEAVDAAETTGTH